MKKTISILLSLVMLLSFAPIGFAEGDGEETTTTTTTIQLSETETITIPHADFKGDNAYSWSDCIAYGTDTYSFLNGSGEHDSYGYYPENNRFIAFKVNAPVSAKYQLSMKVNPNASTQGTIDVYLDRCLVGQKALGGESGGTTYDVASLQMTQGEHVVLIKTPNTTDSSLYVANFQFKKLGDMETITFRATDWNDNASGVTGTVNWNTHDLAAMEPSSVDNQYAVSSFGAPHNTSWGYSLTIPKTGKYLLSGSFKGTGEIQLRIGTAWSTGTKQTYKINNANYKEYHFADTVELLAGTYKIWFYYYATNEDGTENENGSIGCKTITLEQVADSSVLDNINSATDGVAIKDIINGASGKYINDMKYDMSKLFMPEFVTKALVNQSFANLERVKSAFDTAYATESASPSVQLIKQKGANDTPVTSVTEGATHKVKVKADLLTAGSAVVFCQYSDTDHSKLTKAIVATAEAGEDVETTTWDENNRLNLGFWLDTTTEFKVYFLDNLTDLQPIPLFQ